jgi:glutathione S-transferase/translation elongation factor EF-1beta
MTHTIYKNGNSPYGFLPAMVADFVGLPVKAVNVDETLAADADFKKKKAHGALPFVETADGKIIRESAAISSFFAREAGCTDLYGRTAFEECQIESWMSICHATIWPATGKIFYTGFGHAFDMNAFNDGAKTLKDQCKMINSHLSQNNKNWLVGERLTLADMSVFCAIQIGFSTVLDAGFRKAMPQVSEWYLRMSKLPVVAGTVGYVKMCDKPIKPVDPKTAAKVECEIKKVEAPKKVADECDDLFGSDDEEADAVEAANELKYKAAAAKAVAAKKASGKVVIAKSILVWDVKPFGSETDLNILAKKILLINMDGLSWKTEWKKEPVAYGVFKVQIGAIIEDDKVSADDVSELMEAICDPSSVDPEDNEEGYMVQSTEIVVFNKL